MKTRTWVSASLASFLASASIAIGCWIIPNTNGPCHNNDSTCNMETSQRLCFICCSHFNGSLSTPGGIACAATCPANNPGGEGEN